MYSVVIGSLSFSHFQVVIVIWAFDLIHFNCCKHTTKTTMNPRRFFFLLPFFALRFKPGEKSRFHIIARKKMIMNATPFYCCTDFTTIFANNFQKVAIDISFFLFIACMMRFLCVFFSPNTGLNIFTGQMWHCDKKSEKTSPMRNKFNYFRIFIKLNSILF